jgi:uncharacterized phage-associated protein
MVDALDYAMFFMQKKLDSTRNSFDGNMKLQKLLFFANFISLAERDVPLFNDEMLAYKQGCVVEEIRLKYKNDCSSLVNESSRFMPMFSQDERDVLDLTIDIFGKLSARELSDINHSFTFWNNAYNNSIQGNGYYDKSKSVVAIDEMRKELTKMHNVINAYRETKRQNNLHETINDVMFYYSPTEVSLTDDILDQLYNFSLSATDKAYSIYFDEDELVIY